MMTAIESRQLLVQTRIHPPPLRPQRFSRPRLIERIDSAETKLTLIVSPAGYGKTTLLTQWVRQRSTPVAWLSLGADDNVLPVFLTYLLAAIGEVDQALADALSPYSAGDEPRDAKSWFAKMMNHLSMYAAPWILVLDDYHVITNDEITHCVTQLIEHTPPACRIVIASRMEPPLPLGRLRVRGEFTRLDANDLRVTLDELPVLLGSYDIVASPSERLALNEQTSGWIAALHLAAIHASEYSLETVISSLRHFNGDVLMLGDYLLQEVLNQQHPEMREFLLRSSILDRFTASTCRTVTRLRRAGQLLDLAVRRNLFVVLLDQEGGWYHYHHLFGDFLRRQLELEEEPGMVASLNQAASGWFEQQGLIGEAITYATRAGDWQRAATLISGLATRLLVQQREGDLLAWLQSFPPAVISADPNLSTISAYALARRGAPGEAIPLLDAAEQRWRAEGSIDGLATVYFVRGAMARFSEDATGLITNAVNAIREATGEQAVDADGRLAPIKPRLLYLHGTWLGRIGQMLSYAHLAMGLRLQGRIAEAATVYRGIEDAFVASGTALTDTYYTPEAASIRLVQGHLRQAEELCRSFQSLGTRGLASERMYGCAVLGDVLREWNRLDEAEALLREGIDLAARYETPVVLPQLHNALARTLWASGQMSAAYTSLDSLCDVARQLRNMRQVRIAATIRIRMALADGDLKVARDWMAARGYEVAAEPHRGSVDEQFLLARSQTALGDADQAIPLLTWMAAEAERDGRGYDLVQIEVLRSLAYLEQVQLDSAVSALRHALHLAEPEGYVRVFLDEGVSMFRLLEIAQGREVEVDAIGDLLAVRPLIAGDNDRGRRLRLGRSLTSRERSVLRLLAVGLTIAEMSDVLSISVDSVKLDLFRVYLKLGVASRTAAVHRARELGLFTTTAQERPDTSDEAAI